MDLPERLNAIATLVAGENERLKDADLPSFYPFAPHVLARVALKAIPHIAPGARSLDMGAGTGAWWLFMAAAGVPSYAIEIHPALVAVCERLRAACVQRSLIDPSVPCAIACGDMVPVAWRERYDRFRHEHGQVEASMPGASGGPDPYATLGTPLDGFGVIYCWAWPTQSRFLYNLLAHASGRGALLILPAYERYTTGEHMNASMREPNELLLETVATHSETVIGRRIPGSGE